MGTNKRKQDNLQQLINSLSPAEKRSFKLFTNVQVGDKKYLELFDSLEKEPAGDLKDAAKKLKLTAPQLASNKHYLNQMLLKSLRNNDEGVNKTQQQVKAVIDAYNLYDRGLYTAALSLIDKTLEDAWYFEKYVVVYSLLSVKSFILGGQNDLAGLKSVAADRERASAAEAEYFDFYALCMAVQNLQTERKNKAGIIALLRHPLLKKKPGSLQSVKAAACWFNAYQMVYDGLGHNDKLLAISQQMVAFTRPT